jgi:hypothetical protein
LREIEFDRATGKLSDSDYNALKAAYSRELVLAMRAEDAAVLAEGAADADERDAAEALVSRFRGAARISCGSCGPRPESDALYCSSCGKFLPGACSHCGATVVESGARFCSSCGDSLAA